MMFVETVVSEKTIRVRIADEDDPTVATEWIDLLVLVSKLASATNRDRKLEDLESRMLAELQVAALHRARDVIADEIRRLSATAGHRT